MKLAIPRIVIAGTQSGAGKTTVAMALMAAFTRRGLRVQPFKVGPDFIDPQFHSAICGRPCRNLDGAMLSQSINLAVFGRAAADADLAIIEGVMGLFDGRSAQSDEGSTAAMAKWLEAPVLLVVNAAAMARSAAAVVHGFESFDPNLKIAGVLYNSVGSARHAELLTEATSGYCRAAVLAALPRNKSIVLPERHLGLTLPHESLTSELIDELVAWIETTADLEELLAQANRNATELDIPADNEVRKSAASVRIGVARDAAFSFYYQDNLDLLARCGAELVPFSPLSDASLPPRLDGLYLGGGYPELHGVALSQNHSMLQSIRGFADNGGPVYAECGGFMYLTEAIVDAQGCEHLMAGVFPTRARMQPRLAALGYREPQPTPSALWARDCRSLRGHEFRYSLTDPMPDWIERSWAGSPEGYRVGSVLGSYAHLHFLSDPAFAENFVAHCASWRAGISE